MVYSGVKESADDYLRSYMDQHQSLDLLLITSDRALRKHAISLKIESIPALDFLSAIKAGSCTFSKTRSC